MCLFAQQSIFHKVLISIFDQVVSNRLGMQQSLTGIIGCFLMKKNKISRSYFENFDLSDNIHNCNNYLHGIRQIITSVPIVRAFFFYISIFFCLVLSNHILDVPKEDKSVN